MGRAKRVRVSVIGFWIAVGVLAGVGYLNAAHYAYLQTVALIFTLIAVLWYAELTRRIYRENQIQARTAVANHESYKLSVAADWLLKLNDRFDAQELSTSRYLACVSLLAQLDGRPSVFGTTGLEEVWDFFDTVGMLLRRQVLDDDMIYGMFFHWVNGYRRVGDKVFIKRRTSNPELWKDFIFLYDRLRAMEEKRNPGSRDLEWNPATEKEFLTTEQNANHKTRDEIWRPM